MLDARRTALLPLAMLLAAGSPPEMQRWRTQASEVTITRDDWGIAHVRGKSDADAVFGMIYAQAEDDFPRIEANYLTALGRTAEADGEKAIWQDLRARLYVSEAELKADYARSPDWLRRLMDSWAAGLNYYLATHPQVKPRVLARFEPWMALSFTEGSIGGDIEKIDLGDLEKFYGGTRKVAYASPDPEPRGSNGIAVAPAITRNGKTLLLINPHTSFFFRSEQQVTSDEGLNAYGAATWGQFFIYQGFNPKVGWMHTSSGVDNIDEFALEVQRRGARIAYRYGREWRPLGERPVTIRYRTADDRFAERRFVTFRSHHGPVVKQTADSRWVGFAMMHRPIPALEQSFRRTKARDFADFLKVASRQANSSNNTILADAEGTIAYLHPQFVPRRDNRFDYTKPVDGSNPATDWRGLHGLAELPSIVNPPTGWVQNTNNHPWSMAGPYSPKAAAFPRYMDMNGENFRGAHALQLLTGSSGWTLERLQAAAYDSHQPGFAVLIPTLVRAYDRLGRSDPRRRSLAGAIAMLRRWDYRWGAQSEAQTIAMFWGEALLKAFAAPPDEPRNKTMLRLARDTSEDQKLAALEVAVARLTRDFGNWSVPWNEVDRFQRISSAIDHRFSDAGPSIGVPFASSGFGSLAAFGASAKPGTKRWYGTSGNSFVAVVEFGKRVRARAVTAGGESGDPNSPHFNDQAARYAAGDLRPVYFYPDELASHIERRYAPGR